MATQPTLSRHQATFARRDAERDPHGSTAAEGNTLIVGQNIQLKGEITACERLVVEGRVEASMHSANMEIAEGGIFQGEAEVEIAEIRGRFDGNLTARRRLLVRETGQVSGTIRYAEISIEAGGRISGNIEVIDAKGGARGDVVTEIGEGRGEAKTAKL